MRDAFTYIFNMSITSSYVIIAVLFVRLLISKAPKKYSYFLWSVVAFRLSIPFSFESLYSLFSLKTFDMTNAQTRSNGMLEYVPNRIDSQAASSDVTLGIPSVNTVVNNTISNASVSSQTNILDSFLNVFAYVWLIVMVLILLYGLISYITLRIKLSNAVCKNGNIYESDKVFSPFILGLISPKIYIPFNLDDETYSYVIAHERCHLARFDYWIKTFAFILLALHWFNPLCYLAFYLMTKDMEMSCDEKVLSANSDIKKNYSLVLLSFSVNEKTTKLTPLCFGENSVKARIKNALNFRKPKLAVSIISVVLCILVVAGCAANPLKNENTDSVNYEHEIYDDIDTLHIGIPDIIYADKNKLILHGNFGIVVYDLNKYEVTDRVPLSKMTALGVNDAFATDFGKVVYMCTSADDSLSISDSVKYTYSLNTKEITAVEKPFPKPNNMYNVLSPHFNIWEPYYLSDDSDEYKKYVDSELLSFYDAAIIDNYLFFLQASQSQNMNSLMLFKVDLDKEAIVRETYIFDNINHLSSEDKIYALDSTLRAAYYSNSSKYGLMPDMITALTGAKYIGDSGSGIYIYSFRYDEDITFTISMSSYDIFDPMSITYFLNDKEYGHHDNEYDLLVTWDINEGE